MSVSFPSTTRARVGGFATVALAAALALTGCASSTPAAGSQSSASTTAADAVSISDAWVKAAESGMSAAFGELVNDSDADVTVISATSAASSMLELHETVENDSGEMVMQPIEGGFVVPAHGSLTLSPGGDHLMLIDLTAPLAAGDEASFTLEFSDGTSTEFTAPVKDYSGANETYEGESAEMDMGH